MNIQLVPLSRWSGVEKRPLVFAGPHVAESREQLFEIAKRLSGTGAHYLSAGIWQAHTRPESFEGMGDEALPWLREAARMHGLRSATEVAGARHVAAALRHEIDLLWIDGRTTSNPHAVQELANALRGSTVPILIQNPPTPDLQSWLGAIERIASAGVRAIGAMHSGTAVGQHAHQRRTPSWNMVLELRRQLPEIPLVSDACSMSAGTESLAATSQRALDLGVNGLMYRSHPHPGQSWSKASQQVTPELVGEILSNLSTRNEDSNSASYAAAIEALREQIDTVDNSLLAMLAERMKVVGLVADLKRVNNVTALQPARWQAVLADRMERAAQLGINPAYVQALYEVIHHESVRYQSTMMSDTGTDEGSAT